MEMSRGDAADATWIFRGDKTHPPQVPAVGHAVWSNKTLNLKGIAIGNGLTDPEIQYAYYKDQIVSTNGHDPAVRPDGLVHKGMVAATPACVAGIKACNAGANGFEACLLALEGCELALYKRGRRRIRPVF